MRCICCDREIPIARKVKIRRWLGFHLPPGGPDSAAYKSFVNETTYRWGVVCLGCYRALDNEVGAAPIGGEVFNLAGSSRRDKAAVIDEQKFHKWQRREAMKLGLDHC